MTDNETPEGASPQHGVVDPTIFETGDDMSGGLAPATQDYPELPAALQRQPEEPAPEFTTQVDEGTGQTEVVVAGEAATEQFTIEPAEGSGGQAVTVEAPWPVHSAESVKIEDDLPPSTHNMPADPAKMRREFFQDVNKFGKASGEGASALGRLGLRSLRAAADGILSTAKPQSGGKDDATLVYEAYAAMDSKHAEHTAGGAKANASKLRQIIGMGCMTTLCDPVAIGDKVVRIREEMEGADLKPKALFAGLVDVARDQQASDVELTDAAIRGCLTKSKADKTLEKEWEAIGKRIDKLVTGEGADGLKDQSPEAIQIQELVTDKIKNYKSEGTRNDRIDDMMENGYTRAQAIAIVDRKISLD